MGRKKKVTHKYNIWIEIEEVEVDENGDELEFRDSLELPEKVAQVDTLEQALALRDKIIGAY